MSIGSPSTISLFSTKFTLTTSKALACLGACHHGKVSKIESSCQGGLSCLARRLLQMIILNDFGHLFSVIYSSLHCLVAEQDKVLVGELNEWVANPLGPGQTSALQIKARSA